MVQQGICSFMCSHPPNICLGSTDRLVRALLHARLPSWADEETAAGALPIPEQRMG